MYWTEHCFQVDRGVNDAFVFNQESEFIPVLGQMASQLNASSKQSMDEGGSGSREPKQRSPSSIQDKHHPALLALLADELSVAPEEIHNFDLYVSAHLRRCLGHDRHPGLCMTLNRPF
jgi:aspartyl aminopeptidase